MRRHLDAVLASFLEKYHQYVDSNPGAKCAELDVVREAICWVNQIAPILARPPPKAPKAFDDDDDDDEIEGARKSGKGKATAPPPPKALADTSDSEVRIEDERMSSWLLHAPSRLGPGVAQTSASRSMVRHGFIALSKSAGTFAAAAQAHAEAEKPTTLAGGRSSKVSRARGRTLGSGHLAGGLAVVQRKVNTARYRESDDWWEQGGEEGDEAAPAEECAGVSMLPRLARRPAKTGPSSNGTTHRTANPSTPRPSTPKLPYGWTHMLPVLFTAAEGVRCKGAFYPPAGMCMQWYDGVVTEATQERGNQWRLQCFFPSDDYVEEWPLCVGESDPLLCFPTKGGAGGLLRVSDRRLAELRMLAQEAAEDDPEG